MITVETIQQLQFAKQSSPPEIMVKGDLANKLKMGRQISKTTKCVILGICLPFYVLMKLAPFYFSESVMRIAEIFAPLDVPVFPIAVIVIIMTVIPDGLFLGYVVSSYSKDQLILKRGRIFL
ncbi:hypothetical protein [Acinetobacter sp. MD2(2019)]|uniref:hypothetical protein n=1 Tax=Acinetobacter sp. MD2(2019) TaxID=2605273 RepID=UPI002D1EE08A|nr:hypothetical protein [Acinetobacter sp. MD2(2019)]MEB3753281.1 hypothetical protein [Acinetobacter sp. MD2(2019)]